MRRTDADELRRAYRDHVDAVYAFFAYSGSRPVAEDLTSATFEKVIRSWRSYDSGKAGLRTWILTIARNQLTDHYRRSSHRRARSLEEEPALLQSLTEADVADGVVERQAFAEIIAGAGERERQVLALRFGADLSAEEIAELLELGSANNVHQISSRALRKLRAALAGEATTGSARRGA